jgi:hypothetical protein
MTRFINWQDLSSQINNYKKFTMVQVYDGTSTVSPHPPLNLRRLVVLRCLLFLVLRFFLERLGRSLENICVKTNHFMYVLLIYYIITRNL